VVSAGRSSIGTARPATNGMRHIAITGTVDGKNVSWMELVTDEQYTK
jgi:hypothetical protein